MIFKSHLDLRSCPSLITPNISSFEFALITDHTKSIVFAVIYRPPPSRANNLKTATFLMEFDSFITEISTTTAGKLVVTGDFNVHMDNLNKPETNKFITSISSVGLHQFVQSPTHRLGHTLDLVLARPEDNLVSDCIVHDISMSDHYAVHFTLNRSKPCPPKSFSKTRNFQHIDMEALSAAFSDKLKPLLLLHNVNDQAQLFGDTVTTILDDFAPVRTRTRVCRHKTPWYNDAVHKARRVKRRLERQWRKSKLPDDRTAYNTQITVVKDLINDAKRVFFCKKLSHCNVKDMYKTVHTLLNTPSSNFPSGDNLVIANNFAKYFVDKVADIRGNIQNSIGPSSPVQVHPVPELARVVNMLSVFPPTDTQEVTEIIKDSPNKSCALDTLPTWLLKANVNCIAPFLVHIINSSLSSGKFPNCFQQAMVTPILKKPTLDHNDLKNYRPISNTSFLSKLLEKIVYKRLIHHVSSNNLDSPLQSAYKRNHSTETALLLVQNDILRAIDCKKAALLVMLDLSSAFDTLDQTILLNRLSQLYGVRDAPLSWFTSYFRDRKNRVRIEGTLSDETQVEFGVPQGSVLGPALFAYYIKPVANIIKQYNLSFHIYADDIQLYTYFNPAVPGESATALKNLSRCISHLQQWMASNMLKLNSDKTEFFVAASPRVLNRLEDTLTLNIGSMKISAARKVKNLGVFFDSSFSMSNHVSSICKSVNFHLRNLWRIRKYIDHDTCHHVVRSFITSRLDYCNSLLFGITQGEIHRLQKLQNRAARLIFSVNCSVDATSLISKLHWLPIKKRLSFKLLLMVYKCLHGVSPPYLSDLLTLYQPGRIGLRSSDDKLLLSIPKGSKSLGDRSFSIAGPKLWNSIPINIRNAPSIAIFRKRLKTFLFS